MIPVGIDTGGTFTDVVFVEGGEWKVVKVPSTPHNPAEAVLEGLKRVNLSGRRIVHGTTVATNALLERKGAKTALITNRGFEDVLEIGRQNRDRLYDLHYRRPPPLVPADLRFGVKGRLNHRGEILEEIDPEEIRNLAEVLKGKGVESVAVCLLHSYANPIHEQEIGKILKETLNIHVSLSSEILPEFREYERTSTTVVNAFVSPKMSAYIGYLEDKLPEGDSLSVMQSNGGIISPSTAKREAVRTILSGPAGGVVSALHLGKLIGRENLITFDMGGTSTDVSLIEGTPTLTTETNVNGSPIKVPMIDIHTIGAGGGSVAWIDEGGILRVGPKSAGSYPGPVCYGRGGKEITVTDANLYLGRLPSDHFLGGEMDLHPSLLEEPLKRLSEDLSSTPMETALAILEVANSNMERALRRVSVQRGYDPSRFSLITYGGAGGLHAVFLARSLNIPEVIVPPNPGIFSAMGMILADLVKDYSVTVMLRSDSTQPKTIGDLFSSMVDKALGELEEEGFPPDRVRIEKIMDMRYVGQSYEISVPYEEDYISAFHRLHEKTYGYKHDREVEIVNLRVRAIGLVEKPELPAFKEKDKEDSSHALLGVIKTAFGGEFIETKIYSREKLRWNNRIEGGAIVVEYSSTTLIPPGSTAHVDRFGNLIIKA